MAEKKSDGIDYRATEAPRPPLQFLVEREELIRKFVLAEILGPPRAHRRAKGAQRR